MKYKNQYEFDDICESKEFSNELKTKFGDHLYEMFIKYFGVKIAFQEFKIDTDLSSDKAFGVVKEVLKFDEIW